jgi:hypothetical protein
VSDFTPVKITLVYVGICITADKKPGCVLRALDNNQGQTLRPGDLVFDRKSMKGSFIGGMYEIEQTGETSYRLADRKYVGRFADNDQVGRWQLEKRAIELTEEALRAERSAAKELPYAFARMEPLRGIYRRALPNQKRAIEVLLLEYLRRGT